MDSRANCCGWTPAEVAKVIAADFRADCRVAVAMTADVRGNCHGGTRGNYHGKSRGRPLFAMVGATEFATDTTAVSAIAPTAEVPRAVALFVETHFLWNPTDFHISP